MPHLPTLLIQIGIILLTVMLVGWILKKLHQPRVVGEMIAGILLGPSFLGWLAPNTYALLFPQQSLGFLYSLSQVGLLLFMFMVGLELDLQNLRDSGRVTLVTSSVSILVPFFLGVLLATSLYPSLSFRSVSFIHFALFMGTALSITAFPVLARILEEQNLHRTRLGAIAIACAGVNDVTSWCILAGVTLLVRADNQTLSPLLMLSGIGAYALIMWFVIRTAARKAGEDYQARGTVTKTALTLILLLTIASSLVTEVLGIHALFGAFFAGVVMPKDAEFSRHVVAKIEAVTTVMLLPLFFAFTGLRTDIFGLTRAEVFYYCAIIIVVAVVGKFGGATLASHFTGLPWREAIALGILLNTRGLIELIVLNIGLELGVITQELFTIMVLMALATTIMATPLLKIIYPSKIRTNL